MDNEEIKKKAIDFANRYKNLIAQSVTNNQKFIQDEKPVSIFMAGSPGAGKTEFSKSLIDILEKDKKHKIIRIDADEYRNLFPDYVGSNSHIFQGAISIIVDRIHDLSLKNNQTFLLDGTLSNYEKAIQNINRSIKRSRPVYIFYVHQRPDIAI